MQESEVRDESERRVREMGVDEGVKLETVKGVRVRESEGVRDVI